jgi:hypothetical protein
MQRNFTLSQNYPNPFNPSTTIAYHLEKSDHVTLSIYDIYGREIETIVNLYQSAGEHVIVWQAQGMPGGTYFCRLSVGDLFETKNLILQ